MNRTTTRIAEALTLAKCEPNTAPRFMVGVTDSCAITILTDAVVFLPIPERRDGPVVADSGHTLACR